MILYSPSKTKKKLRVNRLVKVSLFVNCIDTISQLFPQILVYIYIYAYPFVPNCIDNFKNTGMFGQMIKVLIKDYI